MAVTVDPLTNGDFARINRADAITGWTADGSAPWSMIALNTSSQVENTGCIQVRVPAGIGSLTNNFTSRSLENVHLRMWVKLGQSISAAATYGARLIVGTESNHGSWIVYDSLNQVIVYNGWMMLVVDPRKPFDATVGTPVTDILTVTDAGCRVDFVDGNGKDLAVGDMLWEGNEVSIEGGTTGARGTFAEWATADESSGYGILRPVGGTYYMNAGAVFQGTGTATSYFEDSNRLVVFEDLPVSGSLYKFRHVGNATGTNHFQLGSSTGSGTAKEGSAGGVIQAAGGAPFRIEAIDTNIDVAAYFGVTMIGPSALYDDQVRNFKVEDNGTGFTDDTLDANDANTGDAPAMPTTQALNDASYFGHDEKFYEVNIDLGTAKTGTWTGTWEYYNGSTWASLTDVTDGTSNYATTGPQTVTYAMPDNWAKTTIDSDNRYWVRFRISSFTSSGTAPVIDECSVAMAGDIRWEDPACEMIGCTLNGMGSVRVRNGAFLKKTTITNSRAPAKHAAVDLGSADPTADTVRDLTIQNCSKGILLKGTGNVTYNFRNIQFAGNTNDVRVDFGGSDTVTINVLEGGDTPSVDNVNGSTIVIENPATTKFTVEDVNGTAIQNARVLVETADNGGGSGLPFEAAVTTLTQSAGTATLTASAVHGLATNDYVVIRGAQPDGYNKVAQITVTSTTVFTYTVPSGLSSPATGTPVFSYAPIGGLLTNASGVVTSSKTWPVAQGLKGWARKKNTSTPFYQDGDISVVNASGGTDLVIVLQPDE
jgi:hypothetical protein